MCWEDVEIARATESQTRTVNLTTTITEVLPRNPNRYGILIPNANITWWWWFGSFVSTNRVISMTPTSHILHYTIYDLGMALTEPIYAKLSAGGAIIDLIETQINPRLMPKHLLSRVAGRS